MPAKHSSATALLQKVNSQLRGERTSMKAKNEDELAVYLNNLTQKTQQNKTVNFEEYGDFSLSSGTDAKNSGSLNDNNSSSPVAPASRFLKKKAALNVVSSTSIEKEKTEMSGKNTKNATLTANTKAPYHSKSSAKTSTAKESGLLRHLSKDSESEGSIKGYDIPWKPDSAETAVHRKGHKFLKSQRSLVENDQYTIRSSSPQSTKRSLSQEKRSEQRIGDKHKDEIVRTLGSQFVPSDQDSLAEFIQGLSMSDSSAKRPQNLVTKKQQKWRKKASSSVSHSPSPVLGSRSPSPFKRSKSPFEKLSRSVSQDTEMADLMDSEILENRYGSDNSDDPFSRINLMDVASLLPSSPPPPQNRKTNKKHSKNESHKPSKYSRPDLMTSIATTVKTEKKEREKSPKVYTQKPESQSRLFDTFGIHMADELLHFNKVRDAELDISEVSEIKTESLGRQKRTVQRHHKESDKAAYIGNAERKIALLEQSSPETSVSKVITVANDADRRSPNMDVTDVEYSDSFVSESKTVTQGASLKSKNKKSRAHGSQHDSHSHRKKDHKVVMEEMLVDVSLADGKGSRHHWNTAHMDVRVSTPYGLQYMDPTPVATHVVSADALEALTAYSPNMLALQQMMKVQLQMVQNFVDIQRRIYQSCLDGLNYDYKYTTLEDTKQYISKNRKSHMTFKDALQLIEEEANVA